MPRPNIIRADTLDLQDQDSPSAAEHQKPQLQGGLAPHQRAEVHHVMQERTSEEHALADAWKMADNIAEEPEAISEAQQLHQTADVEPAPLSPNIVQHTEGEEGGESSSSEAEADDDMMDRVSSSPSIDDGGYTLFCSSSPPSSPYETTWPQRKSSLSPSPQRTPTPTSYCATFNQSASSPASSLAAQSSQYLPLHVRRTGRAAQPLFRYDAEPASSSPYLGAPLHLPLITVQDADDSFLFLPSEHHQQLGRYVSPEPPEQQAQLHEDEGFYDGPRRATNSLSAALQLFHRNRSKPADIHSNQDSPARNVVTIHDRDLSMVSIENPRGNAFVNSNLLASAPALEESPSFTSSINSVDLQDVLLPMEDPLLDPPPSPASSSASWESVANSADESMEAPTDNNDDDTDALFLDLDDRFIDSGWGGECLRETEDIDFEFVYALHTFVATVEGQANATKGDTMVLLDDSNSYWWLVRVVKDGSIGYLPAEHIETPTERLARLNKHRNIDLSATMLGDNSEKTRNPLKKLRRRNMKTVQFAAPTYVEASDYEYDDEDEEPNGETLAEGARSEATVQNGERSEESADKAADQEEPARASTPTRGSFDREQAATILTEDGQISPKLLDKSEAAPLKSRKARNTDSFLKDDSIETRKITLTPGLLREEQQNRNSTGETSLKNDSLESLVKSISPPETVNRKDSKKDKKEKKEGMFRGFFKSKKKDKKGKEDGDSIEEKLSAEDARDSSPALSPLASGRSSPGSEAAARGASPLEAKSPQDQLPPASLPSKPAEPVEEAAAATATAVVTEQEVASPAEDTSVLEPPPLNTTLPAQERSKESPLSPITNPLAPITNILKRDDSKNGKPAKAKRAKQRVELDDFDTPADEVSNPFDDPAESEEIHVPEDAEVHSRLSESPVEITSRSSMHGTESVHIPTPTPYDQPDGEDDSLDDEEPESMTSSPSIIEHPAEPLEGGEDDDSTPRGPQSPNVASTTAAIAAATTAAAGKMNTSSLTQQQQQQSLPTRNLSTDTTTSTRLLTTPLSQQHSWSDSSLRAWLEDGSEVKDMMVMIHDKTDVVPVGADHPLMAGLFAEPKRGVQDMMNQLDGLLGNYLERKGIAFA